MKRYVKSSKDTCKKRRKVLERAPSSKDPALAKAGEPIFAATDILDLLSQIAELEPYDISMDEPDEGILELVIGDSVYDMMM